MTPDQIVENIGLALSEPLPRLLLSLAGGILVRTVIGIRNYRRHGPYPKLNVTVQQLHETDVQIGARSIGSALILAVAAGTQYPVLTEALAFTAGYNIAGTAEDVWKRGQLTAPAAEE